MIDLPTRLYRREKYACHLEIGRKRITPEGALREPERVAAAMTKVLARCVRDQAVITGQARVEAHREFLTDRWMLRAWAYAFQGVRPEDADTLRSFLESPTAQAVEIVE